MNAQIALGKHLHHSRVALHSYSMWFQVQPQEASSKSACALFLISRGWLLVENSLLQMHGFFFFWGTTPSASRTLFLSYEGLL